MKKFFNIFLFFLFFLNTNIHHAKEILIYADSISYDENKNIIAKGKAKVISENEILTSDLIILDQNQNIYLLPEEFQFKDQNNNFYYGSSGTFSKDLNNSLIKDVKIQLIDGSRIVGKSAKRNGHIDIISKGVYSPCKSRIKVANFICPTWQLEGEKLLHDNKNLFLYQKHSKMRVVNTPVFYLPYLVTPSPLRKERKSGFLTPSINVNFFDTKVTQNTSFPYYFNISEDKELTLTPIINYGGGVDSSQRFIFDYNQIISGGSMSFDFQMDTTFEKENSDKWLKDALLVSNYKKNLNEKFKVNIDSTLQTSNNYIQTSDPQNELSYVSSLRTVVDLEGYNLRKIDDKILFNFSTYQINQNDEDNKTTPTVFPFLLYNTGNYKYKNNSINNDFEFYNIFREKSTDTHAQKQYKLGHVFYTSYDFTKYHSNISIKTETHNQFYKTKNKSINDIDVSGDYLRIFPIAGITIKTPFKFKNTRNNFLFTPNASLVITPGKSNSNKLSNETSSNNIFTIENNYDLNRFTGNDKLDNSKRINYGINVDNGKIKLALSQNYEFTNNSNYHKEQGNNNNLSDLLGNAGYTNNNMNIGYNFRYDPEINTLNRQELSLNYDNFTGIYKLNYLEEKSETNNIITDENETLNYNYESKKFKKFSKIKLNGLYDMQKNDNKEYGIGYSYFDECFGINIDFNRKFYSDNDLKPQDTLTMMFSFKNIGSYRSSNLAVSENDKQDIQWESNEISNEMFN